MRLSARSVRLLVLNDVSHILYRARAAHGTPKTPVFYSALNRFSLPPQTVHVSVPDSVRMRIGELQQISGDKTVRK